VRGCIASADRRELLEAAHEREYRNALVFQRKYSEAALCNEAILRLLGSGLAQLLGGVRLDDLGKLAAHLNELETGEIADEFARVAGSLTGSADIGVEALEAVSAAVDSWTIKAAGIRHREGCAT